MGRLQHAAGDPETADLTFAAAVPFLEALLDEKDDRHVRSLLAFCCEYRADAFAALEQPDTATSWYARALVERKSLGDLPQYQTARALLLLKLGGEDHIAEALQLAQRLVADCPDHPKHQALLGLALLRDGQFGVCIQHLGKLDNSSDRPIGAERDFCLAMAHQQRGEPGDAELAAERFRDARQRMLARSAGDLDLLRLHDQAAAMLNITVVGQPETPDASNAPDSPESPKEPLTPETV